MLQCLKCHLTVGIRLIMRYKAEEHVYDASLSICDSEYVFKYLCYKKH